MTRDLSEEDPFEVVAAKGGLGAALTFVAASAFFEPLPGLAAALALLSCGASGYGLRHAHRHDDGHHNHEHLPPFVGEHTHAHRHERVEHEHDHGPDNHHEHRHS